MKKPRKNSFEFLKEELKISFLNKTSLILCFMFIILNFFLYIQYSEAIKSFALLETNFTYAEIIKEQVQPVDFLSNKFTCETKQNIPGCNNYFYIFVIIFILLEVFVIRLILINRKVQKKILVGLVLALQLFLIAPLLAIGYAPYRAFDVLGQEANKDIIKTVRLLNDKEELRRMFIEDSLIAVSKKVEAGENLPILIDDHPKEESILQTLGIKQNKKESLYKTLIIPHQAYYASEVSSQKEKLNFEILLFPDNTLIINSVNKNLIKELVPVLADKIVRLRLKAYLGNVTIYPIIDVPSEQEYILIRKAEDEEYKNELLGYIQQTKDNIAYNQSVISKNEANIIEINKEYDRYKSYGENWLSDCRRDLGAGHKDCIEGEKTINSELQGLMNARQANEEANKNAKLYITESKGYLYLAQQNYDDFLKNPVSPEAEDGVFVSPNTIHLKYQTAKTYPFSQYLAVGIHEYLHFYSRATSSIYSKLPVFIDEGITQYLALTLFKSYLGKQPYINYYPDQVDIVDKIDKIITESELKNIYFSKNENKLAQLIDDYLAEGEYERFKTKGNLLYTGGEDKGTQESLKKQIYDLLYKETNKSN